MRKIGVMRDEPLTGVSGESRHNPHSTIETRRGDAIIPFRACSSCCRTEFDRVPIALSSNNSLFSAAAVKRPPAVGVLGRIGFPG